MVFEKSRHKHNSFGLEKKYHIRGFTILELLVVLAVIGLLTSVVLVLLSDMRTNSRDARRVQDIETIQKALALYETSNAMFPIAVDYTVLDGTDVVSQALLSAGLIPDMPNDPRFPSYTYEYVSTSNGNDYIIRFCLETDFSDNDKFEEGCNNTVSP